MFAVCRVRIYAEQRGFTPLIRATVGGHLDCVRILIESGAKKETKDDVRGIALYGCDWDFVDAITGLLRVLFF